MVIFIEVEDLYFVLNILIVCLRYLLLSCCGNGFCIWFCEFNGIWCLFGM